MVSGGSHTLRVGEHELERLGLRNHFGNAVLTRQLHHIALSQRLQPPGSRCSLSKVECVGVCMHKVSETSSGPCQGKGALIIFLRSTRE